MDDLSPFIVECAENDERILTKIKKNCKMQLQNSCKRGDAIENE